MLGLLAITDAIVFQDVIRNPKQPPCNVDSIVLEEFSEIIG